MNQLGGDLFCMKMIHSVSGGLNPIDYDRYRGWEEGVVESVQRLFRTEVFSLVDISISEALFEPVEKIWPYNYYIDALESIREAAGINSKLFYMSLLKVTLKDRLAYVRSLGAGPEFHKLFAQKL